MRVLVGLMALSAGCSTQTPERYCEVRDIVWTQAYAGDPVVSPLRDREAFFRRCEAEMKELRDAESPVYACRVACLQEHSPSKHATKVETLSAFRALNRCDAGC